MGGVYKDEKTTYTKHDTMFPFKVIMD